MKRTLFIALLLITGCSMQHASAARDGAVIESDGGVPADFSGDYYVTLANSSGTPTGPFLLRVRDDGASASFNLAGWCPFTGAFDAAHEGFDVTPTSCTYGTSGTLEISSGRGVFEPGSVWLELHGTTITREAHAIDVTIEGEER